jgi:N-acetylglucosamine-6-sulfatase
MNENGERFEVEGYTTDILTDRAIEWMEAHGEEGPFCLFLWHKAPHVPLEPAPRHRNLYDDLPIPVPPNWGDTFVDKPAHYRRGAEFGNIVRLWKEGEGQPTPEAVPPPEPWISQGNNHMLNRIRTYLECQQAVDEGIERVLDALEETGLGENTLVLYTSDNGMNLWAHHYTPDKRTAWEESIRIPLLIRLPGLVTPGTEIDAIALNTDFMPTFLELAGIEPPGHLHGRSLVPLLRGEATDWRESMLYMYHQHWRTIGFPTLLATRTDRYKYIHLPEDEEHFDELYDLKNDPYELRNLFPLPEYADLVESMQKRLREHLTAVDYDKPAPQIGYQP